MARERRGYASFDVGGHTQARARNPESRSNARRFKSGKRVGKSSGDWKDSFVKSGSARGREDSFMRMQRVAKARDAYDRIQAGHRENKVDEGVNVDSLLSELGNGDGGGAPPGTANPNAGIAEAILAAGGGGVAAKIDILSQMKPYDEAKANLLRGLAGGRSEISKIAKSMKTDRVLANQGEQGRLAEMGARSTANAAQLSATTAQDGAAQARDLAAQGISGPQAALDPGRVATDRALTQADRQSRVSEGAQVARDRASRYEADTDMTRSGQVNLTNNYDQGIIKIGSARAEHEAKLVQAQAQLDIEAKQSNANAMVEAMKALASGNEMLAPDEDYDPDARRQEAMAMLSQAPNGGRTYSQRAGVESLLQRYSDSKPTGVADDIFRQAAAGAEDAPTLLANAEDLIRASNTSREKNEKGPLNIDRRWLSTLAQRYFKAGGVDPKAAEEVRRYFGMAQGQAAQPFGGVGGRRNTMGFG